MSWLIDETDDHLLALKNLLGPEAMKKRAQVPIDLGKPLAEGVGSRVEIVGGYIIYDNHTSTNLPINSLLLKGLRSSVTGIEVKRTADGRITTSIRVEAAFSVLDVLHEAMGFKAFDFHTSDEFMSKDVNRPSILQGIISATIPAGTHFPAFANSPAVTLPFDIDVVCYTQAVGFLEGNHLMGTFEIDYQYGFHVVGTVFASKFPARGSMLGEGRFDLLVK